MDYNAPYSSSATPMHIEQMDSHYATKSHSDSMKTTKSTQLNTMKTSHLITNTKHVMTAATHTSDTTGKHMRTATGNTASAASAASSNVISQMLTFALL